MRHARANQGFRVWEPLTMRYGSSTFTHTETSKSYCSFPSVYFSPSPLPTPLPQPQQTHRRPNEGSVGIQLERGKGVGFSSTETKTYKTKTTYGRRREPHMRRIVDEGGCNTLARRKTHIRGNTYRILLPGNFVI